MPLTYDPNRVVIICASSPNRFAEECTRYNIDPASPGFKLIYTPDDLATVRALALPSDTPWCVVGGTGAPAKTTLERLFGPAKTFGKAIAVYEVDVAIRPELLRQ